MSISIPLARLRKACLSARARAYSVRNLLTIHEKQCKAKTAGAPSEESAKNNITAKCRVIFEFSTKFRIIGEAVIRGRHSTSSRSNIAQSSEKSRSRVVQSPQSRSLDSVDPLRAPSIFTRVTRFDDPVYRPVDEAALNQRSRQVATLSARPLLLLLLLLPREMQGRGASLPRAAYIGSSILPVAR